MSKSVVFNGNSGSMITKKRKRAKGANHVIKSEIKQYNPLVVENGTMDNYGSIIISNIMQPDNRPTDASSTNVGSWVPLLFAHPTLGTGSYQRIGKQYYLKYMRILGHIEVGPRVAYASNWRMVLLRVSPGNKIIEQTTAGYGRINMYGSMFKNWEQIVVTTQLNDRRSFVRHNYFKKIVDVNQKDLYARKVIASGVIPATATYQDTTSYGSNALTTGVIRPKNPYSLCRRFPLDIKVKCNDWLNEDDHYYLLIETDNTEGLDIGFADSGLATLTPDIDWGHMAFNFNFFVRCYFTDP